MRQWERLEKKCSIRTKTLKVVIEELKQRVAAVAINISKSYWKIERFWQNRLLQNNYR